MSNKKKKKKEKEKSYKKKKYEAMSKGKDARIAEITKIKEPERDPDTYRENEEAIDSYFRGRRR